MNSLKEKHRTFPAVSASQRFTLLSSPPPLPILITPRSPALLLFYTLSVYFWENSPKPDSTTTNQGETKIEDDTPTKKDERLYTNTQKKADNQNKNSRRRGGDLITESPVKKDPPQVGLSNCYTHTHKHSTTRGK
jgi:hypothetical protein